MSDATNPYLRFQGTPEWHQIDRALQELSNNKDIIECTGHAFVVGYLCNALANPLRPEKSHEEKLNALRRLQEAVKAANPTNRDLVQELLDERRREAAREEAGF